MQTGESGNTQHNAIKQPETISKGIFLYGYNKTTKKVTYSSHKSFHVISVILPYNMTVQYSLAYNFTPHIHLFTHMY